MEFLSSIPLIGSALSYLVPFLFILTIIVFFHELGHFLVARWCGVRIETFSVGFGKEIFGWNDRHGTRWKIAWIPLGGYVKFYGDAGEASSPDKAVLAAMSAEDRKVSFQCKPLGQRTAIVAAGPMANFILSIVIFSAMFFSFGQNFIAPEVGTVRAGSPAEQAGFKPGDLVKDIDGSTISTFNEMKQIVVTSGGQTMTFTVEREGRDIPLSVTPIVVETENQFGTKYNEVQMGVSPPADAYKNLKHIDYNVFEAVQKGTERTWFIVKSSMTFLGRIVTGRESAKQLGGPVRIAQISGDVAKISFLALINLAAFISVSIGLINLFPIPMLDGGHLLFYAFEAVRGKPLGERAQEMGLKLGLVFVLFLMVFATWNDFEQLQIFKLFSNLLS